MIDTFRLQGRVALLTGATGGIGQATARLLAWAGAELILTDRHDDALKAFAGELRANGAKVHTIVCDLGEAQSVRDLGRDALAKVGRIDVLICNAGMEGHVGPIGQAADSVVDALLAVNLRSAMLLTGIVAPAMAKNGIGSIVLVASIAGVRGNKSIGLYGLAKAALTQLARNLAVEWGPQGVRVNAISPGLIKTAFARPILSNPEYLPRRLSLTPLRRAGEPTEIAASILFLASDAAGFITGHNLIADGGTTISDGN